MKCSEKKEKLGGGRHLSKQSLGVDNVKRI